MNPRSLLARCAKQPITPTRFTKCSFGTNRIQSASSSWHQALSDAEALVKHSPSLDAAQINPATLLGAAYTDIPANINSLIQSSNSLLNKVASYYFQQPGKHIRPLVVLLMSQAVNATKPQEAFETRFGQDDVIDQPFHTLPPLASIPATSSSHTSERFAHQTRDGCVPAFDHPKHDALSKHDWEHHILPSQRRLAEITEMIHTASLLHDDVIDAADKRRGQVSVNNQFGNKFAILGGDFLLARASVALARLRNVEVVELLATVIETLVEGEIMQLSNKPANGRPITTQVRLQYYLDKSYMKTGSLFARSCKASTLLIGASRDLANMSYTFGKNLGLAFQVMSSTPHCLFHYHNKFCRWLMT
jgi:hexaprenyl-diphosphate synthase